MSLYLVNIQPNSKLHLFPAKLSGSTPVHKVFIWMLGSSVNDIIQS